MTVTTRIVLIFTLLFLADTLFAQGAKFNADEKKIIELADRRTGIDEIVKYLKSPNEHTASRAAIALANIGDTSTRGALIARIAKETRPVVTDAFAFALGVLGANAKSHEALVDVASTRFSDEIAVALGRTVTKESVPALVTLFTTELQQKSAERARSVSLGLSQLGLRKLMTDEAIGLLHILDGEADPATRWHAIYSLVRGGDSAMLARHLDVIKEYLSDVGSPECRMFAATALGNIHNTEVAQVLLAAARGETEWRVQVNLLNAIARLPFYPSGLLDLAKKAVAESSNDTTVTMHAAIAALNAIDRMLTDGKVSSADSVTLIEWFATFNPSANNYEDKPLIVRATALVTAARFGTSCMALRDITDEYARHNRAVSTIISKAVGNYRDTAAMYVLLRRMFASEAVDVPYLLDGLHEQWQLALRDSGYWKLLDSFKYVSAYRHLVIRFADQTDMAAIVGTTMDMVTDPRVVVDSFKTEANTYLLNYLSKFNDAGHGEHISAVLGAVASLRPPGKEFIDAVRSVYTNASTKWGNAHIASLARATLDSLGATNVPTLKVTIPHDSIDWKALEAAPDTLLVPTRFGFLFVKLLPYDAPLTCLNMLKLARTYLFVNTYFHRIVPNFVIQTGDPTGTGFGGPGYAIRTEISPTRYDEEGMVGMASDGKDTEGSQWFITHCPTPHLDTRYTIWGKVVRNLENIDKIQLDDQVENVIPYK